MADFMIKSAVNSSVANLPKTLADDRYARQRHSPQPDDACYLPLADLLSFLKTCGGQRFGRLLDYGCGGSPYRGLFDVGEYVRADYVASPGIDCRIDDTGVLPMPTESCDAVLSTQVLEHVLSPTQYLAEASRVLRPGGTLILSTHGFWEDHGCPYDFWRWTADGLKRQVETAGFAVKRVSKLTTGPRALLFLLQTMPHQLCDSRWTPQGLLLWLINRYMTANRARINRWGDRRYADRCIVSGDAQGHRMYIGVGVVAVKGDGPINAALA